MTQPDSSSSARATPESTLGDNPLGIAGLEFVEFSSPDPEGLARLFETLGFVPVARHVSKAVTRFRQGSMNFLLNAEPDSFATRFAESHGVGIAAIGIRVLDAQVAHERALEFGAWDFEGEKIGPNELAIPAIQGIGDSHIYFVDHWPGKNSGEASIYDIDFRPLDSSCAGAGAEPSSTGLLEVDHFTQTVGAGRIQEWLDFYREVLHFSEIHQVHPDWHVSQDSAVTLSPCGSIRIPVYEEGTYRTDLMQQYLPDHEGEGGFRATASTSTSCARAAFSSTAKFSPMARRSFSSRPSSSASPATCSSRSSSGAGITDSAKATSPRSRRRGADRTTTRAAAGGVHCTTIVPVMCGCSEQKYLYVPGLSNTCEKLSPLSSGSDLKLFPSSATVCSMSS
jgi:4-hydroxyphenylpyruvate dioxygenase